MNIHITINLLQSNEFQTGGLFLLYTLPFNLCHATSSQCCSFSHSVQCVPFFNFHNSTLTCYGISSFNWIATSALIHIRRSKFQNLLFSCAAQYRFFFFVCHGVPVKYLTYAFQKFKNINSPSLFVHCYSFMDEFVVCADSFTHSDIYSTYLLNFDSWNANQSMASTTSLS